MGSKIHVNIDAKGNVQADFIAFPDRSCEEAESVYETPWPTGEWKLKE